VTSCHYQSQKHLRKRGINSKTVCVTDDETLEQLKKKAKEKEEKKGRREKCKLDRERRKLQKEKEKKVRKKPKKTGTKQKTGATEDGTENLTEQNNGSDESEAECPSCGLVYGCAEDDEMWIFCDWCGQWWDIGCTAISDEDDIPDELVCSGCNYM